MTQEEKQLLLVDLCARLPYGVKILHKGWNFEWDDELSTVERVVGIDDKFIYTKVIDTHNGEEYRDDKWPIDTFDDKLFLRPMSSMTEEEKEELLATIVGNEGSKYFRVLQDGSIDNTDATIQDLNKFNMHWISFDKDTVTLYLDWLNAHHFDYRGLIEKGLALEAPEGMYNLNEK